jgi:hypothetical protein
MNRVSLKVCAREIDLTAHRRAIGLQESASLLVDPVNPLDEHLQQRQHLPASNIPTTRSLA